MLDGVSGRKGQTRTKLETNGWKWVRGISGPGCYITADYALAKQTCLTLFGIDVPITSNGTHAMHNYPTYEEILKKEESYQGIT
jgi:hypothetical protein